MTTIEIVRAGAGSGKTTNLCETVADAVKSGLDPARLLATTFTKKAAAELKSRIQSRLLQNDDHAAALKHADRLELAAIGTVHGVAHQLLSRYALDLGLSPRLEVLTEQSSDAALRDLLGAVPFESWQPLADAAASLEVADLSQKLLALLSATRGNRISGDIFRQHMAASADRVCELLAPNGVRTETPPAELLYELAADALRQLEAKELPVTDATTTAWLKLRRLRRGETVVWGHYLTARNLKAGKRSGADAMLEPLRLHAATVQQNPHLHQAVREFSRLLTEQVLSLNEKYISYKSERGLVDFTDLEVLLLDLLENDELAVRIARDFDLILVDEFQDTNPLQLAIFQRFQQFAPRSRWVGDPKQAIYGFRGTDPELVNSIWGRVPESARTHLPKNHRSQRGLVQLVGTLFTPIFGKDAQQKPHRSPEPRGVERWVFNTKNQDQDAIALACGIAQLHAEGIRYGDIAVLERTNRLLDPLSQALDELGIPYLMESPGLFSTREGAMLLAGLRLVADRNDSLAAATVVHLLNDPGQTTPEWILERLSAQKESNGHECRGANSGVDDARQGTYRAPWECDPRFAHLEQIDHREFSPAVIVQRVIEALRLPALIQTWGEPSRRCPNLDSVLRHASEFEEAAAGIGVAPTLGRLILHLENLASNNRDMRFTSPGHDAVTLMNYHGSKGLEWPVVVLSGLNHDRDADLWSPVVSGGCLAEKDPLEGRILRSWIWPFGESDSPFGGLKSGSELEPDALNSAEGLEQTEREREERMRLLYVGCTRARQKLVFAHRSAKCQWLNQLPLVDSILNPELEAGEHELKGIETTYVLRHLDAGMIDGLKQPAPEKSAWIACNAVDAGSSVIPRFQSPSQAVVAKSRMTFHKQDLPGAAFFPSGNDEQNHSAIGHAVHSYLAALPSLTAAGESHRLTVAERCLQTHCVSGVIPASVLVSAGERFCDWVKASYPDAVWHVEVPVSGPRLDGGTWVGAVDLILQLNATEIVVVDHKSAPIRREHCAQKAAEFEGQLAAYSEILQGMGLTIRAALIHFPLAGTVVQTQLNYADD